MSEADQATVDQTVKGARAAMAGEWGNMSSVYRSARGLRAIDQLVTTRVSGEPWPPLSGLTAPISVRQPSPRA